ncbi:hypothetical protein CL622_04090 [archaeon]|nr:hypothetical protein [archaeon]
MLSYNQTIKLNKEFAQAHMVLKTFGNGEAYKLTHHSQQDWFSYPCMWMEDLPIPINGKEYQHTFRVYFVQQVATLKDREDDQLTVNYSEAKSDMIECAKDLLSFWAKDTDYYDLDLIRSTVITTFEDDWQDLVTGCYVDLKLKQAFKYNKCAIPMTGITPPPEDGCADASLNINATFYGNIVSGGTLNLEVRDTSGNLVGFNDGGIWRVPEGVETPRLYARPMYSGAIDAGVNGADGDVYWRKVNEIGKLTQPDIGIQMRFAFGSLHLLDYPNVFGNLFALTGETGGYYDPSDTKYYDKDGVETTRALAFPNELGVHHVIGYLVQTVIDPTQRSWQAHCAHGLTLTIGIHTGFYPPSIVEMTYFGNWGVVLGYTNNVPYSWGTGLKLTGDHYTASTTQAMVAQAYNHMTSTPKANNNRMIFIKPIDINTLYG